MFFDSHVNKPLDVLIIEISQYVVLSHFRIFLQEFLFDQIQLVFLFHQVETGEFDDTFSNFSSSSKRAGFSSNSRARLT